MLPHPIGKLNPILNYHLPPEDFPDFPFSLSTSCVLGIVLSAFSELVHSVLIAFLWGTYNLHLHLIDEG